ncbi:MAG TPA: dTDP-4-dehydrorhamnose reductase [Abditibacteriaceae bacterium]|jgi:dTDP-4-dehydrorhamnose reductase
MQFGSVLVAGANGNLAREIIKAVPDCRLASLGREVLDVTDAAAIAHALDEIQPDLVINGAAYNLVDKAESEPDAALRLNALAPAVLARECAARDISLVHFSTDFIFDGLKQTPYVETDLAQPLGVYGASKLAGENMVLAASPRHFAIRVCRLFGPAAANSQKPAGNFPLLMLRLAAERKSVRVVNDQIGAPSYTPDLARAVWQLVQNAEGGLFQLSNAGEVSFADYAREVFRLKNASCDVEGVSSEEYGAAARRPKYSTLSNAKANAFILPLRDWREALEEFLR